MKRGEKPLGQKAYGHIPHLPGSRMGPGDHHCHAGQEQICTAKLRDKHDEIIVQEKIDGSCVSAALLEDKIVPLVRAGYIASTSPYSQHQLWAEWVRQREQQFRFVLNEGERIVGEWIAQAHGTIYHLTDHQPFVAFDIMDGTTRMPYDAFLKRVGDFFQTPPLLHRGGPLAVEKAIALLGAGHFAPAADEIEGVVYRVERHELLNRQAGGERCRIVDFLAKWVRPDKVDGKYLPRERSKPNDGVVWLWRPSLTLADGRRLPIIEK